MSDKKNPQSVPSNKGENSFTSGVVLGAALGAGAFFLFGTQKGRIIKDELLQIGKEYLEEFEKELKANVPEIHEKYESIKNKSAQVLEEAREQVPVLQEKAEDISQKAVETVEQAKQELPALQQKTAEIAQKAQDAIESLRQEIPGKKEEVEKEIEKLQESMTEAAHKAETMQQQLRSTAATIERKFFFKKGKSLKK